MRARATSNPVQAWLWGVSITLPRIDAWIRVQRTHDIVPSTATQAGMLSSCTCVAPETELTSLEAAAERQNMQLHFEPGTLCYKSRACWVVLVPSCCCGSQAFSQIRLHALQAWSQLRASSGMHAYAMMLALQATGPWAAEKWRGAAWQVSCGAECVLRVEVSACVHRPAGMCVGTRLLAGTRSSRR